MTDEQIIKALECCTKSDKLCDMNCPLFANDVCLDGLFERTILDLINRQKAEIERLYKEVDRLSQVVMYRDGQVADAIKEFAERLKETSSEFVLGGKYKFRAATTEWIDDLVKEMVGDE